ncbi:protein spire-like isoform X1 [Macrosteles quadrilineatus]|uniref:protein spire-like isoform X1 n=1 Tax=Macrosteles quadrilineatus TaxID=74068 RepID=UPI0023E18213|nr:protein spire-like isoform X1 [Macrosteles quadrilineatus]
MMAADVEVRSKCRLSGKGCVSLLDILISFNAPINEEHAWALCFQCAICFKNALQTERAKCRVVTELDQVLLHRDGHVHSESILSEGKHDQGSPRHGAPPEHKVVAGLGLVVFRALDFGLEDEEERHLHPDLDQLISDMTRTYERASSQHAETDDEGIERDSGDCDDDIPHISLDQVIQKCRSHLAQQAESHYRNVCRALVAEALELSSFLDKVSEGKVQTDAAQTSTDLQNLHISDWPNLRIWRTLQARLWVQVIRELRHGVQLKKVCYSRTPIEYELTPYEILMDDIRSRRYKLNKVMVDGTIPHRVKKDAHAVILEFIRSRPPLRKASERKLAPKAYQTATPREKLLESIKQGQAKLRPSASPLKKKVVPFDESMQPDSTTPLKATRRLIKVDFSAIEDDDDEELSDGDSREPDRSARTPWHRTGRGSAATLTHDQYHHYCDSALESYDLATQCPSRRASMRRHTIVVCDPSNSGSVSVPQSRPASRQTASTPSDESIAGTLPEMSWSRSSLQDDLLHSKTWQEECLSLTLEEIVHIRSVLTKAELESLPVEGHVKEDAEKRKVCFLCMKTRFSIFGPWGQICKLCKRTVCCKCYSKMRIPTEHFSHVPVVALSPGLLSPDSDDSFPRALYNRLVVPDRKAVGSAPSSPKMNRSAPPSQMSTSMISDSGHMSLPPISTMSTPTGTLRRFTRSKTLGRPEEKAEKLKGLEMIVCHDCKTMVIQIIKSSRTSRNNAIRNLTLDLSPVY